MFRTNRRLKKTVRFELIPMIDVMMILVLFLAIMAFMPQQRGAIQTDLPGAGVQDKTVITDLYVTINEFGAVYVDQISVTENSLVAEIQKQLALEPGRRVVIAADKRLAYEQVIRLLDTLKSANIRNVALAIQPKQENSSEAP